MAIRYLCYHENADEQYVVNPDGDAIDAMLDSRSPVDGGEHDPGTDPSTFASDPIDVPDFPATGKAWPNVDSKDLLRPNSFGMAFRLEDRRDRAPRHGPQVSSASRTARPAVLQGPLSPACEVGALDPGKSAA